MVKEIIIYTLKKNMKNVYWNAFINQSLPMMQKWQIQVINYGFSIENTLVFHLIRQFDSLEKRNETLEKFYQSDDWKNGARTYIIESIEKSTTTIFEE